MIFETGVIHRGEGDTKESGHSRLVGGDLTSKGTYIQDKTYLRWQQDEEVSHLPKRTLKFI